MTKRAAPLLAVLALGCDPVAVGVDAGVATDAGASPNASILPAPLATEAPEIYDAGARDGAIQGLAADSAGRLILPDAGAPPPEVLRPDEPLAAEVQGTRELAGVTLEAAWRWRDVPAAPKAPEVGAEGIKEAQKLTALTWKIDLSDTGRMRVAFTSRALPMPAGTELRARADRYGTVVVWPNASEYRVVAPGALRPVLGERRVDVTPLSNAPSTAQGEGKRLGVATRKVELSSSLGSVKLELGKISDAGEGGALLCRALVEIVGIDPRAPVCIAGEVPLHAAFAWRSGGGVAFEVTSVTKRTDFGPGDLLCPPPGPTFSRNGLPNAPDGIFLTRDELAAFRTAPLQLPPRDGPGIPGEGFVAVNHADTLAYLLIDGVPVVAVPSQAERYVIGTARGRYVAAWRTFLGDRIAAPQTVELPDRIVYGATPDAGAPDGG